MTKLDKKLIQIIFDNHILSIGDTTKSVSQIKKVIMEEIMKKMPEKDRPRLGSENQEVYVAYSNGRNDVIDIFESVIRYILD